MATQQQHTVTVGNTTYDVQFDFENRTVEFLDGTSRVQLIAEDSYAYSYTHGGVAYQAACDLFWKLEEGMDE